MSESSPSRAARRHDHRAWPPLVLVVVSLLVLVIAPIIVADVQGAPRHTFENVLAAQVAVNDLQEALANAALSRGVSDALARQMRADADRLVTSTRDLDAVAARHADSIHGLIAGHLARGADTSGAERALLNAVTIESRVLEPHLDMLGRRARDTVRRLAVWDRLVPGILVPLTLAAVLLVWLVGRRAAADAIAADEARHAMMQAMDDRAALVRGVTHDLKNPLSAALGYLYLLREGVMGEPQEREEQEPLGRVERLVRDALGTVNDLIDVSRGEGGTAPRQATNLATLARAVSEDYRASIAAAGLTLSLPAIDDYQCVVHTETRRVRAIVENLLSNAVKYTPAGGTISVGVTADSNRRVVFVADTGPGIPATLRDRVFDEFYRVPGSGADGVGIGLAFSRRVARALGGDVTVRERAGGGSVFELSLPG